jgi:hypothetical protein
MRLANELKTKIRESAQKNFDKNLRNEKATLALVNEFGIPSAQARGFVKNCQVNNGVDRK